MKKTTTKTQLEMQKVLLKSAADSHKQHEETLKALKVAAQQSAAKRAAAFHDARANGVSRKDLAKATGLSPRAVTKITTEGELK